MATEKPTIVEALAGVMEDVRAVRKGDRNSQQNYVFRGIDAVMNAAGPALRKHGVIVVPMVEDVNYRDVQTSTGKASRECTVKVRYRFHGPAGDFIDCVTPGESMDFGDKGAPKAMSVAFRIALLQALCLPTDDPEPDATNYERAAPARREQPASKPVAREALEELAAVCKAMGYDRDMVATVYKAGYDGADIRKATDAAQVREFIDRLDNIDPTRLKAPAAAPNGVPA